MPKKSNPLGSPVILLAILSAIIVLLVTELYIRYVERETAVHGTDMNITEDSLYDRLSDYANVQRHIKSEYLRCRNIISELSLSPGNELNDDQLIYCREFVDWSSEVNIFSQ